MKPVIKIFSPYKNNISQKIITHQKQVFDLFNINLIQEYTNLGHSGYLDDKINNTIFDYIIFFDIDCIPLKPGIIEYIVEKIKDKNTLIGVEHANQENSSFVYAGAPCFGISKEVFEKLDKPSFKYKPGVDTAGEFTKQAREKNINVELFNIKSSLNKKWMCGNKKFGNGTIFDNWLYHQYEVGRYSKDSHIKILEYEFVKKCKEVLNEYGNI